MGLIDADTLTSILYDRLDLIAKRYGVDSAVTGAVSGAIKLIQTQPEAVIRCKDCKYCKVYDDIPWCDRLTRTFRIKEESFCSYARRRTDDR